MMELVDAQRRAAQYPDTFELPRRGVLDRLKPGAFVKVCAEFPQLANGCNGERFWARITQLEILLGKTSFVGVIDNDLVQTAHHGLRFGDTIRFETRHIFAVE